MATRKGGHCGILHTRLTVGKSNTKRTEVVHKGRQQRAAIKWPSIRWPLCAKSLARTAGNLNRSLWPTEGLSVL